MPKVAINANYGGFWLSPAAVSAIEARSDCPHEHKGHDDRDERTCPALIAVVEAMGHSASNSGRDDIVVVSIPDDVKWYISEYDGFEQVYEDHRVWSGQPNDGMTVMEERAERAALLDRLRPSEEA